MHVAHYRWQGRWTTPAVGARSHGVRIEGACHWSRSTTMNRTARRGSILIKCW
ncbi:unnamed protein product, partial [Ectocarpus sp. 8 AP-2014]